MVVMVEGAATMMTMCWSNSGRRVKIGELIVSRRAVLNTT